MSCRLGTKSILKNKVDLPEQIYCIQEDNNGVWHVRMMNSETGETRGYGLNRPTREGIIDLMQDIYDEYSSALEDELEVRDLTNEVTIYFKERTMKEKELIPEKKKSETKIYTTDEQEFGANHAYVIQPNAPEGQGQVSDVPPLTSIFFQKGPVKENGVNGIQHEDLLHILIHRVEALNQGEGKCFENTEMLRSLKQARNWDHARTANRKERKVEGTSEA